MNSAWALGNMSGPAIGGALAAAFNDSVPYLAAATLCGATLAVVERFARLSERRP